MPAPPDWLLPYLREFPLFTIAFAAVWFVVRYVDRRSRTELENQGRMLDQVAAGLRAQLDRSLAAQEYDEARHLAEIARMDQDHVRHIRSKDAEIRRLDRLLRQLMARREGES
jgi:hypothetical protein